MLSGPTRYCLNCSYPLDGLDRERCPECGRGFDPVDAKTYSCSPARVKWRCIRRRIMVGLPMMMGMLLLSYGALYLVLVEARRPTDLWTGSAGLVWSNGIDIYGNPLKATAYRWGGHRTESMFLPANQIDRWIRRDYWTEFGVPDCVIPEYKSACEGRISHDPAIVQEASKLHDSCKALNLLLPGSKLFRERRDEILKKAEELRREMDAKKGK